MFVLRNVGKLIFGGSAQESLIELPQGELHLVRPLSPKGRLEQIFRDSAIRIRRTTQDFNYQLVVQRAFDEGEAELEDEEAEVDALVNEHDEKTFLLDETIRFRIQIAEDGARLLVWRDLSGDVGDLYHFRCDDSIPDTQIEAFLRAAQECQYERKYRKPSTTASEDDLAQFQFVEESMIPAPEEPESDMRSAANTSAPRQAPVAEPAVTPQLSSSPKVKDVYAQLTAELYVYRAQEGTFSADGDDPVQAVVFKEDHKTDKWSYWLYISRDDEPLVMTPCVAEMSPVFDFEFLSFVFNHVDLDGDAKSRLLRFANQDLLETFQKAIMQAIWEKSNEQLWKPMDEKHQEYVLDSFADLNMEDAPDLPEEEEEEEEEDEDAQKYADDDQPDSEDEVDDAKEEGDVNSQLAVGYKHDRSFVVRGSKIGVFTHTPNNRLKFSTNISKVTTPNGKLMNPKKVMLHGEDRDLVLQNDVDPNKLYRMDLEYGKVVDEWKIDDEMPVVTFAPKDKFSQMTAEQTFVGASNRDLFRVDPRVSGNKLVQSALTHYKDKRAPNFSAIATTEKGYMAVASSRGDIRLYDRLSTRAKTHLPSLGDPIIGMDVSADGRWILATTQNYILLVDAQHSTGEKKNIGFEKSFAANAKPRPRRLALTNEHVAQFFHETRKGVSFTPAKFNVGEGQEETSIITATGPYIIEWNLKRVLRGADAPYRIKRYDAEVKADDFKFGSDKNVIVALPNEVNMVAKKSFQKPPRNSLAPIAEGQRRSSARISGAGSGSYKLGKDGIVNSPY